MKFTYELTREADGWLATCVESEAAGEGRSEAEAIASLKCALEERLLRPDAVAPPEAQPRASIHLEPSVARG